MTPHVERESESKECPRPANKKRKALGGRREKTLHRKKKKKPCPRKFFYPLLVPQEKKKTKQQGAFSFRKKKELNLAEGVNIPRKKARQGKKALLSTLKKRFLKKDI